MSPVENDLGYFLIDLLLSHSERLELLFQIRKRGIETAGQTLLQVLVFDTEELGVLYYVLSLRDRVLVELLAQLSGEDIQALYVGIDVLHVRREFVGGLWDSLTEKERHECLILLVILLLPVLFRDKGFQFIILLIILDLLFSCLRRIF